MKFKVGDLVRNTYEYDNGQRSFCHDEGLGIVVEIEEADIVGQTAYPQLKVVTAEGITYWWPAVTELADESR